MRLIPSSLALLGILNAAATPAAACPAPQQVELGPDLALELGIQEARSRLRAVVPADFDGDGDLDVFFGNTGDPSHFYWNQGLDPKGSPIFLRGEHLILSDPVYTAAAIDYDNDLDVDLFVGVGGVDSIGYDYLFRNDGGGSPPLFTDVSDSAGITGAAGAAGPVPQATGGGAWADYDNDGDLDLYSTAHVTEDTLDEHEGRNTLFRNNGDGTFTDVTAAAGVGNTGSSWQPSWIDYDDDGDQDLYVANKSGANALYQNQGDGTFLDVTTPPLEAPFTSWGSLVHDLNDDGYLDIFACGRASFEHGYFINDRNGRFRNLTFEVGLQDEASFYGSWMGFQVGDLNNDNLPEICLGGGGPASGESNHLFQAVPRPFVPFYLPISDQINRYPAPHDPDLDHMFPPGPYRTHGMTFADFDLDGDLDLFIGNGGPSWLNVTREPNRYFRNETGEINNWLELSLVGTVSNADGIGARIVVTASQGGSSERHPHHAVVRSVSGFGSNNPVNPHVGLLRDTVVEEVAIYWPSGISQSVSGMTVNTRATITEEASGFQYASPADFIADKMKP